MKSSTAENLMRSAMAPTISAGVMAAKVIWKMTKVSSGMTTPSREGLDDRSGCDAREEQLARSRRQKVFRPPPPVKASE